MSFVHSEKERGWRILSSSIYYFSWTIHWANRSTLAYSLPLWPSSFPYEFSFFFSLSLPLCHTHTHTLSPLRHWPNPTVHPNPLFIHLLIPIFVCRWERESLIHWFLWIYFPLPRSQSNAYSIFLLRCYLSTLSFCASKKSQQHKVAQVPQSIHLYPSFLFIFFSVFCMFGDCLVLGVFFPIVLMNTWAPLLTFRLTLCRVLFYW
jgi:hypothetical protein